MVLLASGARIIENDDAGNAGELGTTSGARCGPTEAPTVGDYVETSIRCVFRVGVPTPIRVRIGQACGEIGWGWFALTWELATGLILA